MPPRCLRGDTKELYSSLSASPGGAYGQIQVPHWQALLGEGQPEGCILWGCLSEGRMRGEEREGQGPGFLFFIFKLFNLRGWRWDNFPLAG